MKYDPKPALFTILTFLIASNASFAARNDRRQVRQQARIHEGVKSGALTQAEKQELRAGQRGIRRAERRMKSDGDFTAGEKLRLEKRQDHQSKKIYDLKRNDQTAPGQAPVQAPAQE